MKKYPLIYAIVVTWNGSEWIQRAIESLNSSIIPLKKIIVVDNNSDDHTTELINECNNEEITLLKLNENLGFGKANNIGIKIAMDHGADFVFLMNQDARIEPNTIEELVKVSINNPEYGILSPFHLSGDNKTIDSLFAISLTADTDLNLISDLYVNNINDIYETKFVNAAFWLLTRNCITTVGGFDPLFFVYGEDNDYIHRTRWHKFKIGICPKIKGIHDRPQNIKTTINKNRIFAAELLNAKTHLPPVIKIIFKAVIDMLLFALRNKHVYKYRASAYFNIIRQYRVIKSHHFQSEIKGLKFLD